MNYLLLVSIGILLTRGHSKVNPEGYLSFAEILEKNKYPYENYTAITEDGHKLHVFRILPKNRTKNNGQPVYLQHGVVCTPEALLAGGLKGSSIYYLADRGYDVWVPNSRGSIYSKTHEVYDTNSEEYWNYTFEEQGRYDQRAVIDLIVKVTGFQKIHYWSHSMGGTQMLAALVLEPGYYRRHLHSAILVAPVVTFDVTRSTFIKILNYTKLLYILRDLGIHEFFSYSKILSHIMLFLKDKLEPIFGFAMSLLTDENIKHTNISSLDVFIGHFPTNTSTKCFKHLIQLTEHKGFYKYREKADDPIVPYDLSALPDDIPLAIFIGKGDLVASPESISWFQQQMLALGKHVYVKVYSEFGHSAFIAPKENNLIFLEDTIQFFDNAERYGTSK